MWPFYVLLIIAIVAVAVVIWDDRRGRQDYESPRRQDPEQSKQVSRNGGQNVYQSPVKSFPGRNRARNCKPRQFPATSSIRRPCGAEITLRLACFLTSIAVHSVQTK
jgi:hypothetical protein